MKKTTMVLGTVAILAVLLANLAILPTLHPGYLAEGDTAPTDVSEVAAASDRLKMAGVASLLAMAIVVERAPPAVPLRLCAFAVVAYTACLAWDVLAIIMVWGGHVRGERASNFWVCVAVFIATVMTAPSC